VQLKPDDINVEEGISMIAIVGQKMFRSVGTSARICGALAENGVNIRMLNQGTGEINVIVGVEGADFEKAIRAIYAEFVTA
jgi:aspartate kinase